MAVQLIVAVTDREWFERLRVQPDLTEVNFWSPGAAPFRALQPGELFLFKLHAPHNFIVGGGVFTYSSTMPCSLAWEAFGTANGSLSLSEMRRRIIKYRRSDLAQRGDFSIGCRILSQPFFFGEGNWLPAPASWSPNIVTFKTYSTAETDGKALWDAVHQTLARARSLDLPRYGDPILVRPRLGQGAFRFVVTDAYTRRCAVTGERTLPALEAAHIRPFAEGGSHDPSNGLLLRRDIHALFDAGYVTVTAAMVFEVSQRIKKEFENGRQYYALHGQAIAVPRLVECQPSSDVLRWHNEERYLG